MDNTFYNELPLPLKKEELNNLIQEYKTTNNEKVKEKILSHNLRLVLKTISRYFNGYKDYLQDDMFSVGVLGLQDAVELYNPSKGIAFSSYAVVAIQRRILRFIEQEEKHLGVISLDLPVENQEGESTGDTLVNLIPGEERFEEEQTEKILVEDRMTMVAYYLKNINPLHRDVFIMSWGIGCKKMTYREIAQKVGLSSSRIEQIMSKTMKRLEQYLLRHGNLTEKEKNKILNKNKYLEKE